MEPALDQYGLRTVYNTLLKCQEAKKDGVTGLRDVFSPKPRLMITPNDNCSGACLHCIADSKPDGIAIDYEAFTEITPLFFDMFSVADFGRRGNPLEYESKGNDLADMIQFLYDRGILEFSVAAAIQKEESPIIGRLEDLTGKDLTIDTLLTYHHYHAGLDKELLARDINSSLKNFARFSRRITVALLGDGYNNEGFVMSKDVQETFNRNKPIIYGDIEVSSPEEGYSRAEFDGKDFQIRVTPVNPMVYPLGRFKKYLSDRDILDDYERFFQGLLGDYVCPDLIKWPGIIIEPDGDLNLCASFEAINCSTSRCSNILTKPYEEVEQDLLQLHQKEMSWFIENIDYILQGQSPCCKIKNNSYEQVNP